ncbi:hypothetical protein CC80DRAFT_576819, partial [Byssothecium circinans]
PQTKSVAAFHQMNCLNHIRQSLYTAAIAATSPASEDDEDDYYASRLPALEHHWRHCLDYLRQSLMCNADITLEKIDASGEKELGSVDGWGTEHLCRDWEGLRTWTEGANRGSLLKGVGT